MEPNSDLKYIEYITMVDNNLKSQKEFIKKIEKDPKLVFQKDLWFYESIKKNNFTFFTIASIASTCISLFWLKKIDLEVHKGKNLYLSLALILFLPFYSVKIGYGDKTPLPYEEYLYTKYVLYKAKLGNETNQ